MLDALSAIPAGEQMERHGCDHPRPIETSHTCDKHVLPDSYLLRYMSCRHDPRWKETLESFDSSVIIARRTNDVYVGVHAFVLVLVCTKNEDVEATLRNLVAEGRPGSLIQSVNDLVDINNS